MKCAIPFFYINKLALPCLDFRRRTNVVLPLTINGQEIENVQGFKLRLQSLLTLKWDDNLRGIIKKSHQGFFS